MIYGSRGLSPSVKWVQPAAWDDPYGGDGKGNEVEFKFEVPNEAALNALAKTVGGQPSSARQFSHFFDTSDMSLSRSGFMLRVSGEKSREHDNLWLITAKGPPVKTRYASMAKRSELEVSVPEEVGREVLAGRISPLQLLEWHPKLNSNGRHLLKELQQKIRHRRVNEIGAFENDRTRIKALLPDGKAVTLELDRTRFPGQVHHELEVEVPKGVSPDLTQRALQQLFADAKVSASPSISKSDRLFQILGYNAPVSTGGGDLPSRSNATAVMNWFRGPTGALDAWSGRSAFA